MAEKCQKKVRVTARFLSSIFQEQQQINNHIILHVGTNDLILDRTSQDIATSIVNIACSVKSESCNVSISKSS